MKRSFFYMLIKDLKLIFRNRQLVFVCLIVPSVLLFLFSYIFLGSMEKKQSIEPMRIAIVDKDNSILTKMLINNFESNKSFSEFVEIIDCTEKEAGEKFNKGNLTAVLKLPSGFSKSIYYCKNYPVDLILNGEQVLNINILEKMMNSYSKYISSVESSVYGFNHYIDCLNISEEEKDNLNEKVSINLITTALSRGNFFRISKIEEIPSSTSIEYFIISIIVVFLMYIGLTAGNSIITERNNRTFDRIGTTPISKWAFISSKCAAFFIFCILFIIIFITPVIIMGKLHVGDSLNNMIPFLAIGVFLIISFSVFLGSLFKTEEELMLFGNLFIFISGLIGGSFIPLYLMPPIVQTLSKFTFNYWMIKGYLYILKKHSFTDIGYIPVFFVVISLIFLFISIFKLGRGKE